MTRTGITQFARPSSRIVPDLLATDSLGWVLVAVGGLAPVTPGDRVVGATVMIAAQIVLSWIGAAVVTCSLRLKRIA